MVQNSVSDNRIVWLDIIRCVAMIIVMGVHYIDPFYVSPTMRAIPEYTHWMATYGSLPRPSVPLFVMITGLLLLLVKKQPLGKFYRKRVYHVLSPFLIWLVLYSMLPWSTDILGLSKETTSDSFCYTQGRGSQSLIDSLRDVAMIPFNFSHRKNHMWHIYLFISLYLYIPFFSAWIEDVDRKTERVFLPIWIISLLIPYLKEHVANCLFERSGYVFGTDTWNEFGLFYYLTRFDGYLLLGHCIKKGNNWSLMETFILYIPMFAAGYYITYTGFNTTAPNPNVMETEMELFFTFCNPSVLLMALATFLLLRKIVIANSTVVKVLANMTQCGLDIYMAHYFVVGPFSLLIGPSSLPIPLQVPLMAICIFLYGWTFIALIYKLMPRKAVWFMG